MPIVCYINCIFLYLILHLNQLLAKPTVNILALPRMYKIYSVQSVYSIHNVNCEKCFKICTICTRGICTISIICTVHVQSVLLPRSTLPLHIRLPHLHSKYGRSGSSLLKSVPQSHVNSSRGSIIRFVKKANR